MASFLRSFGSIIDIAQPGAGSIFGELVNKIIPGLREERFAHFVATWARRTNQVMEALSGQSVRIEVLDGRIGEIERTAAKLVSHLRPENIALFEEGARAAVRALSIDRIERIANLVADGMFDPDKDVGQARAILEIIDQISDEEVVLLCSHTGPYAFDAGWKALHVTTISPSHSFLEPLPNGMSAWTAAAYEAADLERAREGKLARLGLLERTSRIVAEHSPLTSREQPQEYSLSESGPTITRLGKRVLRDLGLIETI